MSKSPQFNKEVFSPSIARASHSACPSPNNVFLFGLANISRWFTSTGNSQGEDGYFGQRWICALKRIDSCLVHCRFLSISKLL